MKWYFACNDKSERFYPLIKGAVNSAIQNTTLEPNFLFDGEENEFTQWLREKGVNVIHYKSSFYDELEKFYDGGFLSTAAGAFLRCDIPIIEKVDDFVLYTDCDVLFLKDFDISKIEKPKYFACSTQSSKRDFNLFNTGVMVMNVKKLRESHRDFVKFITSNFEKFKTFDQDAFQIFYGKKNTKLPVKYNHKPYWGIDEEAAILHFHGSKPTTYTDDEKIKNMHFAYYDLYKKNPAAYNYYLDIFRKYNPEIEYNFEAIEKLNNGIYPLVKPKQSPILTRVKTRLTREINKISVKFVNKN